MGQAETETRTGPEEHCEFRTLKTTLVLGALYDGWFGILILVSPRVPAGILGLELPREEVYLRLDGIFLIILSLFYLLTSRAPGRYLGNVAVAILARTLGAVFFFLFVLGFDGAEVFAGLGAIDLLFAVLHAATLGRRGWSRMGSSLGLPAETSDPIP